MKQFYYYPPAYYINHSTPEGSRVMMIGAQTCYDLQRDYIADTNWDSTEWRRLLVGNRSLQELDDAIRRRGITHVWVAYSLFTFVAEMGRANYANVSGLRVKDGPDYEAQLMNWTTLDLYTNRFLEPVYSDDFGNMIYKVKVGASENTGGGGRTFFSEQTYSSGNAFSGSTFAALRAGA